MKKLFVIQKYVVASSITEALKIEKETKVDEIWLDNTWKEAHKPLVEQVKIGYNKVDIIKNKK